MPKFFAPPKAVPATLPTNVHPQLVTSRAQPPGGAGWLQEIKQDGHRLIAIIDTMRLLSRNGRDRTPVFHASFHALTAAGPPPLVLDGEIAVPDERGVSI